jgi:hypothetical protein
MLSAIDSARELFAGMGYEFLGTPLFGVEAWRGTSREPNRLVDPSSSAVRNSGVPCRREPREMCLEEVSQVVQTETNDELRGRSVPLQLALRQRPGVPWPGHGEVLDNAQPERVSRKLEETEGNRRNCRRARPVPRSNGDGPSEADPISAFRGDSAGRGVLGASSQTHSAVRGRGYCWKRGPPSDTCR